MPEDVPGWWSPESLGRFWDALAERLERNGRKPSGRLSTGPLDRAERHALTNLLGRPVTTDRTAVDLSALDRRLRQRSGIGLVDAAAQVKGAPLVDRPAVRDLQSRRRDAPVLAAGRWLADHPGLDSPCVQAWLQDLRRDGILARDPDPARLVILALQILWDRRAFLREKGHDGGGSRAVPEQPVARTELAARTAHDAHALDDDRRLSSVVLRALVARTGSDLPTGGSASARRALWETAGVLSDTVSSTCLTLQLRPDPSWPAGERMRAYAEAGVPLHITWWDLRSGLTPAREQDVLVCENPRVLEAVAERALPGTAVICTSGRPALVVTELLARVRDSGAQIRYHGDFDWPGIAMANELVLRFGARPWRMSADDYLAEPASLPLGGAPVEPLWDLELGAAMRHRGLAVHEEAVLGPLLGALERR